MRRWLLPIATAAVALAAAGLAIAQTPGGITRPRGIRNLPLVEQGSQLYAANCSSCHGIAGRGVRHPPVAGVGNVKGQGPSLRGVGARAADFY
ncbi:MAG: c-type cytochrome, partial [Thermoleophilaceae bacterium]